MSTERFQIVYKGSNVDDGSMDVRDLAPALLDIGNLLEDTNTLLNSTKASVRVRIKSFGRGSFTVDLEFLQSIQESIKAALFVAQQPLSALALLELLGIAISPSNIHIDGVLQLLRFLKGQAPRSSTVVEAGKVRIENCEGNNITVNQNVVFLAQNEKIQKDINGALGPVLRGGVESVRIGSTEPIGKEDAEHVVQSTKSLTAPLGEEIREESERRVALRVKAPLLEGSGKWRLASEDQQYYVSIEDPGFLDRVHGGLESFSSGDVVVVRLKTISTFSDGRVREEHAVTEVISHIRRHQQTDIFRPSEE